MPGILGAIAGIISAALAGERARRSDWNYFPGRNAVCEFDSCGRSAGKQAVHQLYTLLITLGVAIVGGCAVGNTVKKMQRTPTRMLGDADLWMVDSE
jgi:hypothetical protein